MPIEICDPCGCIPGNEGDAAYHQNIRRTLCEILIAYGGSDGDCEVCKCIYGNESPLVYQQGVRVTLCNILAAIEGS